MSLRFRHQPVLTVWAGTFMLTLQDIVCFFRGPRRTFVQEQYRPLVCFCDLLYNGRDRDEWLNNTERYAREERLKCWGNLFHRSWTLFVFTKSSLSAQGWTRNRSAILHQSDGVGTVCNLLQLHTIYNVQGCREAVPVKLQISMCILVMAILSCSIHWPTILFEFLFVKVRE